jgi:hypothetical protein
MAQDCFEDTEFCRKSDENPLGIPAWKIFAFSYFPDKGDHPVGDEWVLTAEPYVEDDEENQNTYLGYSLEERCRKRGVVPWHQRSDRAYILAKTMAYFTKKQMHLPAEFLSEAHEQVGVKYLIGAGDYDMGGEEPQEVKGLENVGQLGPEEFAEKLAGSKMLIGLGNPILSPTPWEALCLGVPFIDPVSGVSAYHTIFVVMRTDG